MRPTTRRTIDGFPKTIVLALSALTLAAVIVCAPTLAQNPDDVEIKVTAVAGNVHMLEGRGGNIGISAGKDGILIVDDQFANLADRIKTALGKLGGNTPRYVLNTHYHGDHTGGNPVFGKDATIIAHHNVRTRLATGSERSGPMSADGLPVITFGEALSVHFNGERIQAIHMANAHTDGDTVVWFTDSNVIHAGDLVFNGRFPFIDVNSGGDARGLLAAIDKMLGMMPDGAKIIPGHGPLTDRAGLEAYRTMLAETIATVESALGEGLSADEIKKRGLGEKWKSWEWGFIDEGRYIDLLVQSLSNSPGASD